MKNGKVIKNDGTTYWYKNGRLHREDGPALIGIDGSCIWYSNGLIHRADGPAVIGIDGTESWYFCGRMYVYVTTFAKVANWSESQLFEFILKNGNSPLFPETSIL